MMWALIIGTIPTGIVGLVLEKRLEALFHDLRIVAAALMVNGVLLWVGDRLTRARAERAPEELTFRQAFLVGLAQIGALIPGFSRSGLTMIAGIGAGLSAEKAAEFSFCSAPRLSSRPACLNCQSCSTRPISSPMPSSAAC